MQQIEKLIHGESSILGMLPNRVKLTRFALNPLAATVMVESTSPTIATFS
jgi:hypothetical protein